MNIKKAICRCLQLYTRNSIIRTGKVPLIKLFSNLGVFKGVIIETTFLNNIKVRLDLEDWVQQLVYFFGVYEFEKHETKMWIELTKKSHVILDIGANIGYYSLISNRYNLNSIVYSFEPAPLIFKQLKSNFNINGFNASRILNKGVSNEAGFMKLYISNSDNSGMTSLSEPESYSGENVIVEIISIDEFVKSKNIPEVNLVKIDVEGNELNVLKGMEDTLIKYSPILFIEILDKHLRRFNHSSEELYNYLNKLDFICYEMDKFNKLAPISGFKDVGLAICLNASSKEMLREFF